MEFGVVQIGLFATAKLNPIADRPGIFLKPVRSATRITGKLFWHMKAIESLLVDQKRTRFLEYLVEFLGGHFCNGLKANALLHCEKSLRTNEGWLTDLPSFTIAVIQRHGKRIPVPTGRDLAENQIRAWKVGDHQRGPALSGRIIPRKWN